MILSDKPPLLFPELRILAGMAEYKDEIPYTDLLSSAANIFGMVYGVNDYGVDWFEKQLILNPQLHCRIVVMVYPACATQESTLIKLYDLQERIGERIGFNIYPLPMYGGFPTNALTITCEQGKNYLLTGSSPNFGVGKNWTGEFNFIIEAEAVLLQKFKVLIDYMWFNSAPITKETAGIPMLIPAEETREAEKIWKQYMNFFPGESLFATSPQISISINAKTGELTAKENDEIVPPVTNELNLPKYSPMVVELGSLYSQGSQIIVDRISRIGPLDAPVKADYFGMRGERRHGRVLRKTQYRISVLNDDELKAIEKIKNSMHTALDNMSYSLGDGVRWMPDKVRPLYQQEINRIKAEGKEKLKAIVKGDAKAFVESNRDRLCQDLNNMYREVNGGGNMQNADIDSILMDLQNRLQRAMEGNILPEISNNSIQFRDAGNNDQGSWGQGVSLLKSIALYSRKSITSERYFAMGLMVDRDELREAMNVLDDDIYNEDRHNEYDRAKIEIEKVNEIVESGINNREKCQAIMDVIRGKAWKERSMDEEKKREEDGISELRFSKTDPQVVKKLIKLARDNKLIEKNKD